MAIWSSEDEIDEVEFLGNLERDLVLFREPVVVAEEGLAVDFETADGPEPLVVFLDNPPENGWTRAPPTL